MLKKTFLVLVGLAGLLCFILLFEKTFPTASLDLRLNRQQALVKADEYVSSLGYDVEGYQSSVVFSGDSTCFVFLEKCLGLLKANKEVRENIPIWSWQVRFFKELEKEGFTVSVNPIGRIDGFDHHVEDADEGADLTIDVAKEKVNSFLADNGINLKDYELVSSSSRKRENRTDHSFEWKKIGSELEWEENGAEGKGMVRLSVAVYGDKLGSFNSCFFTPEEFDRYIQKLSAEGRFLALISSFFYMLLYVAAIIMFIVSFRDKPTAFKLILGISFLIGIPNLLNLFNSLPLVKAGYDTKMNFIVYYGSELISALKGIINHVIVIIIVFCAGNFLAEKIYPEQVSGLVQFLNREPLSKNIRNEIFGGYFFGFMLLGFITLFYYFGMNYAGVWVFPSAQYSNILGTWFPFLLPLSLSLLAAISEEFIFRMFAISFLKKYLRITFFAVLIPSLIWAFAHSSYAVYPIYTRGIELTIVAFAFSFVFLRYGILACIIAHYVVDAVLFSIPLLRSSNLYFLISGVIVVLLAGLPAILSFVNKDK